jgi:ketosteroid isomerase-like protein
MTTEVPHAIDRYWKAADEGDIDALVATFTHDATVFDEGETHTGVEAIRRWRLDVASKYTYTAEVLGVDHDSDGAYLVQTRLTGDFPGGVAELRHRFVLRGDRIAKLSIAP